MGQAFGIIGLEVMGRNIALNIERRVRGGDQRRTAHYIANADENDTIGPVRNSHPGESGFLSRR